MIRTIKISAGIRKIDDQNQNAALLKLREILNEERKLLIIRMESDLNSYIQYRFSKKANANQLERIKTKLQSLKTTNIDLDYYNSIVQDVFKQENTYVSSESFYREIDQYLAEELEPTQLRFAN